MSGNTRAGALAAWTAHARRRLEPVELAHNQASTPDNLARAEDAASAELGAALAAVAVVRVSLNSLRLACRLPSELVLEVLQSAQVLDPPRYNDGPHLGWLSLTQMCHSWREAALGCSSLWSKVEVCLGRNWANAFLSRSHACPLTIRCDLQTTTYREIPQHLVSQSERVNEGWRLVQQAIAHVLATVPQRITTLDLEAMAISLQPILCLVLGAAADLSTLRVLTVRSVKGRGILELPLFSATNAFPSLTRLSLPDSLPSTIWAMFPSTLVMIAVTSAGIDIHLHDGRIYLHALAQLLRRSTEYQSLSICFERLPSWTSVPGNRFLSPPRLRALNLYGNATACAIMINSLHGLPGLCKLDISVTGANWEALCVDSLISSTSLVSGPTHPRPFTSISITGCLSANNAHFTLHARRDLTCPLLSRTHPDLSLKFVPQFLYRNQALELLTKLVSSVNITRVRSLYLAFPGLSTIDWKATHWLGLLRGAQAVQDLHVRGECSDLIHTLGVSTAAQQHNGALEPVTDAANMVFPSLRSIIFEDVNFNHADGQAPAHQIFSRVLSARLSLSGVPRTLVLKQCQLEEDQARWWESSVPARMRSWDARSLRGG